MAAFIQSQALTKSFSPSHSVLKRNPNANASKVHTLPLVLNPNLWLCRLPQNVFPSWHLKAASSSSKWTFETRVMQTGTLRNRKMAFAVEATAGNAKIEETKERDDSYRLPALWFLPEDIDYRPWIAGFAIVLYLGRTVIAYELLIWLKFALLGLNFLMDKVMMALYTLLNPLIPLAAAVMTGTSWTTRIVQKVYAFIVNIIFNMTSVQAFTEAIALSSAVLGIGEAVNTNAVSSQPYTIGMAGFLGLGAVLGLFSSSIFVALLFVLVAFSLKVMKKDMVSSIMPGAAVLTAVAEPWVRAVALASFLALAIHQNWKSPDKEQVALDNGLRYKEQPIIVLRILALMVGITVAAQWLHFRHLIWLAK